MLVMSYTERSESRIRIIQILNGYAVTEYDLSAAGEAHTTEPAARERT